tara:strand:- start:1525 stop:1929 length:405 start_codon:yes stop_codon:yes gene_type:complete
VHLVRALRERQQRERFHGGEAAQRVRNDAHGADVAIQAQRTQSICKALSVLARARFCVVELLYQTRGVEAEIARDVRRDGAGSEAHEPTPADRELRSGARGGDERDGDLVPPGAAHPCEAQRLRAVPRGDSLVR